MTQNIFRFAMAAIVAGLLLVPSGQADDDGSAANRLVGGLSDGALLSNGSPFVSQGWDGTDWEIFRHIGGTVTQLTNNEFDDTFPYQSGSSIVWQGWDGADWEIFQFDGTKTFQITDNGLDDISPYIIESRVTWQGWDGVDWEIYQYDGLTTTPLTNNDFDDRLLFPSDLGGGPPVIVSDPPTPTPEPSTVVLIALTALGLSLGRWRPTCRT